MSKFSTLESAFITTSRKRLVVFLRYFGLIIFRIVRYFDRLKASLWHKIKITFGFYQKNERKSSLKKENKPKTYEENMKYQLKILFLYRSKPF